MKRLFQSLVSCGCLCLGMRVIPIAALTLNSLPDQRTVEGGLPLAVPLTFGGPTAVASLKWSFGSPAPRVVPADGIRIITGDSSATLVVTPNPHARGLARITVDANDGDQRATISFWITVAPRLFDDVPVTNSASAVRSGSLVDLNGDGHLDVTLGANLAMGSGTAGFEVKEGILNAVSQAVRWADFNGDGLPDAVLITGPFRVALQVPGRSDVPQFTNSTGLLPGLSVRQVDIADIDGDGDLDLVLANHPLLLAFNDGHGNFSTQSRSLSVPTGVALGDLDRDGDPDLLVHDAKGVSILWNDGNGNFTPSGISIEGPKSGGMGALDVDGDGWLDVWAMDASTPAGAGYSVFRRESLWFREVFHLAPSVVAGMGQPAWGDYDGNGYVDLMALSTGSLTVGASGSVPSSWIQLYLNDGKSHLDPSGVVGVVETNVAVQLFAGDFDRDGTLDVADLQGPHGMRVHRNESWPLRPLPAAPVGLQATVNGGKVRLSWTSLPDFGPGAAPTFNVRVGSVPGANDIVPSMSLPSGLRWVSGYGNAGFRQEMDLDVSGRDLAAGTTLYWSVQEVDPSFRGGPWASEQAVPLPDLANSPPQFGSVPEVRIAEDHSVNVIVRVVDDHTPVYRLKLEIESDNEVLLPTEAISVRLNYFSSDWATTFILSLSPAPDRYGDGRVRLTATDSMGLRSQTWIDVHVDSVPDPPRSIPVGYNLVYALDGMIHETDAKVFSPEHPDDEIHVSYRHVSGPELPPDAVRLVREGGRWRLRVDAWGVGGAGSSQMEAVLMDSDGRTSVVPIGIHFTEPPLVMNPPLVRLYQFGGNHDLRVWAAPGERWMVERTADLVSWEPVVELTTDVRGRARLTDLGTGGRAAGYFRLSRPE